ncbi:uncharacterized protein LOC127656119 [Xyrauchen texanus]|uniref:uncharacterized protein LOC127656119 n=1 Tax=Xyrauchen texanus TaxID=154827 RepID=UPI0022425460|nr:uncharacterized protein LOC127656119 [Xyrauchen texanus]
MFRATLRIDTKDGRKAEFHGVIHAKRNNQIKQNEHFKDERNINLKMSRRVEVIINSPVQLEQSAPPVYITESKPGDHPGVLGFLKINPAVLGWLEILAGAVAFGLVFWNYERWLLIPVSYLLLTGLITATAACTRNACLVIAAQVLNLLNIFSALAVLMVFFLLFYIMFTIRVYLARSMGSADIAFVVCNILAVILSLIIFSTSCCWCKSRKRLMIIQMNTVPAAVPNDTVDHPEPVLVVTSPPAYSPVPSSEPPAYEDERRSLVTVPSAPVWTSKRWKEDLHRSRKPIQV